MYEPKVIYMDMPPAVKGFVVKMFDEGEDYYTVVLNPCYNAEQQKETYQHELTHIEEKDLDGYCDANKVEVMRHI